METQTKTKQTLKPLRSLFIEHKVCTIDKITKSLSCSIRTARRRLKELNALNCYNKNGRFYTLVKIASFDSRGLWFYRGVGFSKYGNLTETVVALVNDSEAGLNAAELIKILKLKSSSFLSLLCDHPQLRREKKEGERFVYYSANDEVFRRQKSNRERREQAQMMPNDSEAVVIFIEVLKYGISDMGQLCRRLADVIASEKIRNLFHYHGLTLKKTPHSKS